MKVRASVKKICGIDEDTIRHVARIYAKADSAMSIWTMGINQSTHGSDGVCSINPAVCLFPLIIGAIWNVPFYLGGTSLLIAVVVTMDFMQQVQAHLMSHQYESLMKKANFKS